jgi:hypothetical protein
MNLQFPDASAVTFGVIGGVVGWFATEFVARPVRKLFDLRGEAKRRMLVYWHAPTAHSAIPDEEDYTDVELYKLDEGRKQLEDIGAQLASFEKSELIIGPFVRWIGYDPTGAGLALRATAIDLGTIGEDRDKNFRRIDQALKFFIDESRVFYDPYGRRK